VNAANPSEDREYRHTRLDLVTRFDHFDDQLNDDLVKYVCVISHQRMVVKLTYLERLVFSLYCHG